MKLDTLVFRKWTYGISLLLLSLSGFGQMPIFKRYYIADIPGLAWLAKFYVTHEIHYITASVLLALVFYISFDFLIRYNRGLRLSFSAYVKIGMIILLVVSGVLMVIKNLEGTRFSHGMIIGLDLVHMGSCMGLLLVSLYTLVMKKRWVKPVVSPSTR